MYDTVLGVRFTKTPVHKVNVARVTAEIPVWQAVPLEVFKSYQVPPYVKTFGEFLGFLSDRALVAQQNRSAAQTMYRN